MLSNRPIHVIGFMGKCLDQDGKEAGVKGTGKDTCANMIADILDGDAKADKHKHGMQVNTVPSAEKMKVIISKYYDLPLAIHDASQEAKARELPQYPGYSFRRLLEVFGTNVVRQGLGGSDIWIQKVENQIKRQQLTPMANLMAELFDMNCFELFQVDMDTVIPRLGMSKCQLLNELNGLFQQYQLPNPIKQGVNDQDQPLLFLIPDVRFENEIDMIKRLGGTLICVQRTIPEMKATGAISDQHLKGVTPDVIIYNDGSLTQLQTTIEKLVLPHILEGRSSKFTLGVSAATYSSQKVM